MTKFAYLHDAVETTDPMYGKGYFFTPDCIKEIEPNPFLPELIEALEWYGDKANWNTDWEEHNPAISDRGDRARTVLARARGEG